VRWVGLLVPCVLWGASHLVPCSAALAVSSGRVLGLGSMGGYLAVGWMSHSMEIPPEEAGIRTEEEWYLSSYGVTPEGRLRELLEEVEDSVLGKLVDTTHIETTGNPYKSKVLLRSSYQRHRVRWALICVLIGLGVLSRGVWMMRRSKRSGSST